MAERFVKGRSRLVLLGTVHQDPDGPAALQTWLDKRQPAAITVEISRFGIRFRQKFGRTMGIRLARSAAQLVTEGADLQTLRRTIASVQAYIQMPFEFSAAAAWAKGRCPLVPVDLSSFSRRRLPRSARELSSVKGLRDADVLPVPEFDAEYRRAQAWLIRPPTFVPAIERLRRSGEWRRREQILAARVRRQFDALPPGKLLVHVGGWEHLFSEPDGLTLRSLLADLQPQAVLLRRG